MAIPGRCSAISRLKAPPRRNARINGKLITYQQFGIVPAFGGSNLDNHCTILLSSLRDPGHGEPRKTKAPSTESTRQRFCLDPSQFFPLMGASTRTRTRPSELKLPPVAVLASFRGFAGVT